jgi:hypothetical protein
MKYLLFFILISSFISCEVNNSDIHEITLNDFDKMTFESQFIHLINDSTLLDNTMLVNGLYDSISKYNHHIIFLTQKIDCVAVNYKIDIQDISMADPPSVKWRNTFNFSIFNDTITSRLEPIGNDKQLIDSMLTFVSDPMNSGYYLPEYKMTEVPILGVIPVSKQLFRVHLNLLDSVKNKNEWLNLIKVINKIEVVYNIAREKTSIKLWSKNFASLNEIQKQAILKIHPYRMFIEFDFIRRNPPPPPAAILDVINQ